MHRDESLPCHVVCPQPWKRALETHVERSHQNALAHGMHSDVLEHIDGSDPQVITVNQAGLTSTIHEHERPVHALLPVEYRTFCVRGKLSLMVVKGTEQQKKFLRAMSLETLPEFNDDGTFPNSLHEDVSYCTILPICQILAAV
ncbi:hypothetical protein TNCV_3846221 [Trichonephila clavipes]|nr:hypothetical protein TNCV_3846221 [Trichonephila clavipes]